MLNNFLGRIGVDVMFDSEEFGNSFVITTTLQESKCRWKCAIFLIYFKEKLTLLRNILSMQIREMNVKDFTARAHHLITSSGLEPFHN